MTVTLAAILFLAGGIWAGIVRQFPLCLVAAGLFVTAAGIGEKLG